MKLTPGDFLKQTKVCQFKCINKHFLQVALSHREKRLLIKHFEAGGKELGAEKKVKQNFCGFYFVLFKKDKKDKTKLCNVLKKNKYFCFWRCDLY